MECLRRQNDDMQEQVNTFVHKMQTCQAMVDNYKQLKADKSVVHASNKELSKKN